MRENSKRRSRLSGRSLGDQHVSSSAGDLEIETYRDAPDALRALFKLEKKLPKRDIVLVRADTSDEIREAFKNYFSDARDFTSRIEAAIREIEAQLRSNG